MTEKTAEREALSRDSVEAISARFDEPDWMRERRREAWQLFLETPWPDSQKDEEWRKTEAGPIIKLLKQRAPATPSTAAVESTEKLPANVRRVLEDESERAGLLVLRDGGRVYYEADPALEDQGVIFADIATALREHGDVVQEHLMQATVSAEDGKFEALHGALLDAGYVLIVPDNVAIDDPFQIVHWLDTAGTMNFPHVLVVTGDNTAVTVLEEYASDDMKEPTFVGGAIELVAGENASLVYLGIQNWGDNVWHLSTQRGSVNRHSVLNWSTGQFGGKLTRYKTEALIDGDGATAFLQGIYFPTRKQHIANHTLQHHRSTHTSSDLLYKGALLEQSHAVYAGTIKVDKGAQFTDAYQADRNLMLSEKAHADSIPMLEIEANEVRCTHGATLTQLDEEELFYLMSRGINEQMATNLIVDGFYSPVLERIPLRDVRDRLKQAIRDRMGWEKE